MSSTINNMIFSEPALSIAWQSPDKYVAGPLHLLQAAPEALDGAEHDLGTPEYARMHRGQRGTVCRKKARRPNQKTNVRTYVFASPAGAQGGMKENAPL